MPTPTHRGEPRRRCAAAVSVALDEITRRLRARVPLGPRAGRALDRAAHGRGGLRARRRRARGRRRQAARRAGRRAVPGLLPVAAARGARRRATSPRWRSTAAEADPPPPARVRRRRGRRARPTVLRNWDQIKRTEPGATARIFGDVPENLPSCSTRARSSAGRRRRDRLRARPTSAAEVELQARRNARGAPRGVDFVRGQRRAQLGRPELALRLRRALARALERRIRRARSAPSRRQLRRRGSARRDPDERRSSASTPARSSTRAATRPSRSRSGSSPARAASPRFPRAPRPASSRRSSCATAATPGGGKGVTRAVANVNGEIAEAVERRSTPPTRRRSTAR